MSKKLLIILLITILFIFFNCNPISIHNKIIEKEETVNEAWAQVENVYQRRIDLIPNLVKVVKSYSQYEKETLTEVVKLRNQATQINITKEVLEDPETFKKFQNIQNDISNALSKLISITENYPELKASQQYLTLMTQLEGTENRISVERRNYNKAVKEYNTFIRKFPNNLVASGKFKPKQMFKANEGSEKSPDIDL